MTFYEFIIFTSSLFFDETVKSPLAVIPDLIRDPEVVEKTGFRPSPE
jgi:hypothetical protein